MAMPAAMSTKICFCFAFQFSVIPKSCRYMRNLFYSSAQLSSRSSELVSTLGAGPDPLHPPVHHD
jgi:hypothetical protein